MIQNQPGGLQGLVQSFHDKGMGGLVSSWISSGPNPPISGDQVHQVLGRQVFGRLREADEIGKQDGLHSAAGAQQDRHRDQGVGRVA